ncbi:MAG: MFS transporter [Clostridia bacterium]|nr:MFS transporter [Clostridia bacterium]
MGQSKKSCVIIIFVSWLAYLISYLGRNDYSACILEIVNTTGLTRASAGMISSTFALCNAVGQLISTIIINKVSPMKLISVEIFTVAVINLLFPVSNHFYIMMLLWGINGCMQATLLCGIMRIFSETLEEPWLSRGAVSLHTIGAVGGVINYLLAPVLIHFFHWQAVFFTVSTLLFALGIVWCTVIPRFTTPNKQSTVAKVTVKGKSKSIWEILKSKGTLCALIAVFIIGALRESVSLWIPSYLNEGFKLTVTVSTAITAVVPMLQICGALLAGLIGPKANNLFVPTLITFLLSTACFLIIPFISTTTVAVTVFLFVLNAISMTAALTFLLSLYPIRYMERKNIAKFVGLLNFFVHLGDFAASTGFGWLSSVSGWTLTFSVMALLAFLAAIIAVIGMGAVNKRRDAYAKNRV